MVRDVCCGHKGLKFEHALMGLLLKNCDGCLVSDGVKTDTKVDIVLDVNKSKW